MEDPNKEYVQYQSVIFFHDDYQKNKALTYINQLSSTTKITTNILPFVNFYPAEDFHQNYYKKECKIINPEVKKYLEKNSEIIYYKELIAKH